MENKSIKSWAEDDRPREKLELKGAQSLSNSELLAIIIGSGNKELSAVSLAKKILELCNNNLMELSKLNLEDLRKFKGIGTAKAINIVATLELGKRREFSEALDRKMITSSNDAYQLLKPKMQDLSKEQAWVIYLNKKNSVLTIESLSSGGITSTIVDPRLIFKRALELHSTSIVLSHNHPSGQLKPSQSDIELTKKIKTGGSSLDILLIDHLIISDRGYYSFADEGQL
ncbi:MAG: DNA repair protein RadC [Saprospiraceae bacterium]